MVIRLTALLLLLLASPPARAGARPAREEDGPTLSDDSRWMSFVRLVENRWRIRTQIVGEDDAQNRRLLAQCLDDAWFLAVPSLLQDVKSPCSALLDTMRATESRAERAHRPSGGEYRARFSTGLLAPTREQYEACTAEAVDRADPEFLGICALALRPRASLLAGLCDEDRFAGWLSSCKKAMLGGEVKSGETLKPAAHTPAEDQQARHCLRTLPTLYEVQWLKKLSEFWTPDELRVLNIRTQTLGRN